MLNPDERIEASSGTTDNPNSSTGENKKPKRLTQRQLMARLKSDSEREGDLLLCQLTAEAYRPCHDAINKFKFVHGTSSPNLHMTFNLSMAAKARMNGKNDPNATPRQRYAYMGMCLDIAEVYSQGLDEGWPRDEIKRVGNERMTRTALFNGLGTQKDRKQAKRTQK